MIQTLIKTVLLTLVFAGVLSGVHRLTEDRIEQEKQAHIARQLASILPEGFFDPPLATLEEPLMLAKAQQEATVHLAYQNQAPRAALIDWTTPDGYNGNIRLVIAIDPEGELIAVRVLDHRETPGLGDAIEHTKSDWIDQFAGRSLTDPAPDGWQANRLGGEFDTISSATITSTAVIEAIALTLETYEQERDRLWVNATSQHQSTTDE